jgi:uncharacterized protein (DUF1778 family)
MNKNLKQCNLFLDADIIRMLDEMAAAERRSRSQFVTDLALIAHKKFVRRVAASKEEFHTVIPTNENTEAA